MEDLGSMVKNLWKAHGSINLADCYFPLILNYQINTCIIKQFRELQKVYLGASQEVNRKYMEIVVKQMFSRFLVEVGWDSSFVPGSIVSYEEYLKVATQLTTEEKDLPLGMRLIFWLTQVAKEGASWLSAASFQETVRVMVENSLKWAIDELQDLKSNVILGRPLPIGSNFKKSLKLEMLDAEDLIEMDLVE